MKSKIELNDESVDSIVVSSLVFQYKLTCRSIANLKEIKQNQGLQTYQLEDLEYDKKIKKSLYRVIKHYTIEQELSELGL